MVKFDNFEKVVKFPPSFFSTFIWRSNLSFSFNGLFAQPQVLADEKNVFFANEHDWKHLTFK